MLGLQKVLKTTSSNLPKHSKRLNDVIIIGWNDIIISSHKDARNAFLFWYNQGKPSIGNIIETLKETSKQFKQELKFCIKYELHTKREKNINLYSVCDNRSLFWK